MKRRFALVIAISLILGITGGMASQARAAINAEGAQKVKKMFQELLDRQKTRMGEDAELVRDGEIMVEPSGSYYAVTLPHLSVKAPDGTSVEIGIVALNVAPDDQPEQWRMSIAVPTPITFFDEEGKPELMLHIGKQNAAGIWHEKFENFVKLKAKYHDVRLTGTDGKMQLAIPEISTIYDLNKGANGLWSGPLLFRVNGFNMKTPDGGAVKIGAVETDMKIEDYDIDAMQRYQQQLDALNESYQSGEGSASSQHINALYNLVTDFLGSVWNGFTLANTVKDLEIQVMGPESKTIRIAEAGFDFDLVGFRKDDVTMRLAFDYSKLAITPPPPELDDTMPHTVAVDISFHKLPYKQLRQLGETSVTAATAVPEMGQMVAMQALMSLPQIATQAGTNMTINRLLLANDQYSMRANGNLKADMSAAKGAAGQGEMKIRGLESLIATVQANLKKPDLAADKKEKLQNLAAGLTTLQMVGQQGKNEQGQPVRLYNFELTKEGQLLLNGSDLSLLMGAGQPATP